MASSLAIGRKALAAFFSAVAPQKAHWYNLMSPSEFDTEDPSCTPVDGILKVCNSDYGQTGWKGINECAINGLNKIVQSVAKMNEYYLSGSSAGGT
jgi:hypothetical protein